MLAVAEVAPGSKVSRSELVVLDSIASAALSRAGQSRAQIPARIACVNSAHSSAIMTLGSAVLDAPEVHMVGGVQFSVEAGCTGTAREGMVRCADLYQGLAFPRAGEASDQGSVSLSREAIRTISPGFYSGICVAGRSRPTPQPGARFMVDDGLLVSSGSPVGRISGSGSTGTRRCEGGAARACVREPAMARCPATHEFQVETV
ncbi:MAG: hypothetical protein DYG94_14855 [Leptolyngbya sp. PLA3]|nr:MAG: hypothetical protein EDM82_15165 [Cyanobacteria bacterium CYA]MCE7970009.1 hypothetical protein [Leptolyngbya sp. PL-A3]